MQIDRKRCQMHNAKKHSNCNSSKIWEITKFNCNPYNFMSMLTIEVTISKDMYDLFSSIIAYYS